MDLGWLQVVWDQDGRRGVITFKLTRIPLWEKL